MTSKYYYNLADAMVESYLNREPLSINEHSLLSLTAIELGEYLELVIERPVFKIHLALVLKRQRV